MAALEDVGGKHYVPQGFVVSTDAESFSLDDQHEAVEVFDEKPTDLR
ncbi:unknown [Haloarcula marismortui ATCC 43049]|uniref:Uncharacterized protein n=1 Tax=Haloarcula marismortui (strain ATCC 43049 / DSM 3752 / JCM 8966 / VKM B-1809) TaxID=272569 RepID=Q5V3C5_HALMA|nr:hypothetical protein [Haloarcula marismortui]AAV45977.1 unknown [Haloarcula marismortui ATCC 43049]